MQYETKTQNTGRGFISRLGLVHLSENGYNTLVHFDAKCQRVTAGYEKTATE